MASITATYGGDEVVANETGIHIESADLPSNTSTGYDTDNYPASPAVYYYFSAELSGQDDLRSPVFGTNADGVGEWDGLILPAAGTWTIHARNADTDASAANTTVEVV